MRHACAKEVVYDQKWALYKIWELQQFKASWFEVISLVWLKMSADDKASCHSEPEDSDWQTSWGIWMSASAESLNKLAFKTLSITVCTRQTHNSTAKFTEVKKTEIFLSEVWLHIYTNVFQKRSQSVTVLITKSWIQNTNIPKDKKNIRFDAEN